jgi:hypothetical protein
MEEKEYISSLIWQWAEARAAANENTAMMTASNFSESVMQECAARMKHLFSCEDEMLSLRHSIPQALQNFIDAREDSACLGCWLSSAEPVHQDCSRKIDRFFQTQDDLYAYARRECNPAKRLTD